MFDLFSSSKIKELKSQVEDQQKKIIELKANRSLAEAALKSMNEGVLAIDGEGRVILANPMIEKIFSITEPVILGKSARSALRNNDIPDLMEEVARTGKPLEKEVNMLIPIEGNFMVMASPIRGSGGVVCVLHDITELRKLEKYRSEFIANISHELKTPLTSIRNYVETLLNGAINDQEHNLEFLNKVEKHALNLSALIDDLLELSSLEAKKELGAMGEVDLGQVAGHAVEAVTERARKKKIELIRACAGGGLKVIGMEDHLYRAVLNLLDNALNYTAEGGRIEVGCNRTDKGIELFVSDTGIGIPEEHLPRIFERFYRVDKARSRDLGGTGLGLAIVKHVMNVHNGSVRVGSELGKGSRFTLFFPAP